MSATKVVLKRVTSDGIWQLTQTIISKPANATDPGAAAITMALKNNTGVARGAYLLRHADVDANSTFADNHFDYTLDTATGLKPSFGGGLAGTNQTFSFPYNAYIQTTPLGPAPCNPYANYFANSAAGWVGDGSINQLWVLNVPAAGTKTVKMTYKPL